MKLKYNDKNKFRILQMTDLHIGPNLNEENNIKTFKLIDNSIKKLKPDLIVITGDIIWSDEIQKTNDIFSEVVKKLDSYKIPIAITYGNHDSEKFITRDELRKIECNIENLVNKENNFIYKNGENFCIEIYDNMENQIENILYMFDSGDYSDLDMKGYDYISFEQINWFREISSKYKRKLGKRDIVFMHIPIPEYWNVIDNLISGVCNETNDTISAPYINTGLFTSMYMNGEVEAMFCGHDHDNNFLAEYHGIKLGFGNVTGYNCYGELPRGVRVIDLDKNSIYKMETYNVTESDL